MKPGGTGVLDVADPVTPMWHQTDTVPSMVYQTRAPDHIDKAPGWPYMGMYRVPYTLLGGAKWPDSPSRGAKWPDLPLRGGKTAENEYFTSQGWQNSRKNKVLYPPRGAKTAEK